MNKLGNFNLKDVQKDAVVWEYTDNAAGDSDAAKEDTPKEVPVKRGQVCSLSFLILPFILDFIINCGVCELISPPFICQLLTLSWMFHSIFCAVLQIDK